MKKIYWTVGVITIILITFLMLWFTPTGVIMSVNRIECTKGCTIYFNVFGFPINKCPSCFPEIGESYSLHAISLKCDSYPSCINRTLIGNVQIRITDTKTGNSITKITRTEKDGLGISDDFEEIIVGNAFNVVADFNDITNSTAILVFLLQFFQMFLWGSLLQ